MNTLKTFSPRTVPGYVSVLGSAKTNATVSLWSTNSTSLYATTTRKGEYFHGELPLNNSTGAVWLTLTNLAVLQNGGNPDIVTNTIGQTFVAQTPEAFYYDLDGNLTNDGRWTYTWDAENRLVRMESSSAAPPPSKLKLEFAYDAKGRRVQKLVSTNNGSAYVAQYTNRFVYDGWNLVGVLSPNSSLLSAFVWGLDLSGSIQGAGGVGGLLLSRDSGTSTTNCVAYDGNGNVAALVNVANGAVTANYEYGPFGEVLRATGPLAQLNPFLFSTKFHAWETGLYYYGYRHYDPSTGRWLSRDPIEEVGGQNIYFFVGNNPLFDFDVLGLEWNVFRSGGDRAWAFAECGDTVAGLAKKIHLDASEYTKWLQPMVGNLPGSPDDPLVEGDWYSVPNKVYVNRVGWRPTWIIGTARRQVYALQRQWFKVVYQHDIDNDTVLKQFNDPDIYGFVNVAHGEEESYGHGEIETSESRGLRLNQVQPFLHHKLGGFMLIQCWGDAIDWRQILGPKAYYWAGHDNIHWWEVPTVHF